MKLTWTGRTQEWILDHGFQVDDRDMILIPRNKWNGLQWTDRSIRNPGKHTLCIPSDFGMCCLTEGMHFEII